MTHVDSVRVIGESRAQSEMYGEKSGKLSGHARFFSNPAYQKLLTTENLFRNTVPIVIILFLMTIAVILFLALNDEAASVEEREKNQTSNIATLLRLSLPDEIQETTGLNLTNRVRNALVKTQPFGATKTGRTIYISDANGTILASLPENAPHIGQKIDRIVSENTPLGIFGRRAGIRELEMPNGTQVYAAHQFLTSPLGTVTVIQDKNTIFQNWRYHLSMNVTLFFGTAIILLILLYAYFNQIARAKHADSIYSKTQARIETAFTRGRCGLWDWDIERGRIYWSQSMHMMLGYAPSQRVMSVDEVCDLMHPDDVSLYDTAEEISDGKSAIMDKAFRMQHADGHWVWLRARAELCEGIESDKHLIGIAVDITDQRRIEEKSRTADQRLHDAINSTSEAFVLWDADRKLVLCNRKYQELYSLRDEDVCRGTHMEEVMEKSVRPIANNRILNAEMYSYGERTYEAKLEDGRWLQINVRRTEDGGYVSVGSDITDLKRHQEKLQRHEQSLIANVEDLHRSKAEIKAQAEENKYLAEKLEIEKNNAENANRAKSEFLASMSHELRTPLNAIIGFSEILQSKMFGDLGSEKYEEYANDIHQSGMFLLNVINDVLDMSKIEAGRIKIERQPLNIGQAVQDSIRVIQVQAEEKNINIIDETDKNIELSADKRAIKQILLNLLSNAVKFNHENGKIFIRTQHSDDRIMLVIEDTGIGINKRALHRIGLPFEQVQNPMTRNHSGSGLGLAISKSLAELHGGQMAIDSVEGKGTCITISIPIVEQETQEAAIQTA